MLTMLAAILADILIFALNIGPEHGEKKNDFVGCYANEFLLIDFYCRGFVLSELIENWLNWPLQLVYFSLQLIYRQSDFVTKLNTFIITFILWSPVIVFVISWIFLRRRS